MECIAVQELLAERCAEGLAEGRIKERKDNLETVTRNLMKQHNISKNEVEKMAQSLFSK